MSFLGNLFSSTKPEQQTNPSIISPHYAAGLAAENRRKQEEERRTAHEEQFAETSAFDPRYVGFGTAQLISENFESITTQLMSNLRNLVSEDLQDTLNETVENISKTCVEPVLDKIEGVKGSLESVLDFLKDALTKKLPEQLSRVSAYRNIITWIIKILGVALVCYKTKSNSVRGIVLGMFAIDLFDLSMGRITRTLAEQAGAAISAIVALYKGPEARPDIELDELPINPENQAGESKHNFIVNAYRSLGVVFCSMLGFNMDDYNVDFRDLATADHFVRHTNSLSGFAVKILGIVSSVSVRIYEKVTGHMLTVGPEKDAVDKALRWIESVQKVCPIGDVPNEKRLAQCTSLCKEIIGLFEDGRTLGLELEKLRLTSRLPLFNKTMDHLRKPYGIALNLKDQSASRFAPVTMLIAGDSGLGKSDAAHFLTAFCMSKCGLPLTDATMVYKKPKTSDYYEGYTGQFTTIVEEIFGTNNSNPKAKDNFYNDTMFVMEGATPVPFKLDMATLEDKKNTFFDSKLLIGTTNLKAESGKFKWPLFPMENQDAVKNRFDLVSYFRLKEKFVQQGKRGPKIDEKDEYDLDIWEIDIYDPVTGGFLETITGPQFFNHVYALYHRKRNSMRASAQKFVERKVTEGGLGAFFEKFGLDPKVPSDEDIPALVLDPELKPHVEEEEEPVSLKLKLKDSRKNVRSKARSVRPSSRLPKDAQNQSGKEEVEEEEEEFLPIDYLEHGGESADYKSTLFEMHCEKAGILDIVQNFEFSENDPVEEIPTPLWNALVKDFALMLTISKRSIETRSAMLADYLRSHDFYVGKPEKSYREYLQSACDFFRFEDSTIKASLDSAVEGVKNTFVASCRWLKRIFVGAVSFMERVVPNHVVASLTVLATTVVGLYGLVKGISWLFSDDPAPEPENYSVGVRAKLASQRKREMVKSLITMKAPIPPTVPPHEAINNPQDFPEGPAQKRVAFSDITKEATSQRLYREMYNNPRPEKDFEPVKFVVPSVIENQGMDDNATMVLSNVVKPNTYVVELIKDGRSVRGVLLFVQDRIAVTCSHIFHKALSEKGIGWRILITDFENREFSFDLNDCEINADENRDLLSLRFPSGRTRTHRSLVKHYITERQAQSLESAYHDLILCAPRPNGMECFHTNKCHLFSDFVNDEEGTRWFTPHAGYCDFPTVRGDSGSPIMIFKPSTPAKLFGMNLAGNKTSQISYFGILTREVVETIVDSFKPEAQAAEELFPDVENQMDEVDLSPISEFLEPVDDNDPSVIRHRSVFKHNYQIVAKIKKENVPRMATVTRFVPSLMFGKLSGVFRVPATLIKVLGPDGLYPIERTMLKGDKPPHVMTEDTISLVKLHMKIFFERFNKTEMTPRLLSDSEVLNGVPGKTFLGPINIKGSHGWPYVSVYQSEISKVGNIFCSREAPQDPLEFTELGLRVFAAWQESAKTGRKLALIFRVFTKDERKDPKWYFPPNGDAPRELSEAEIEAEEILDWEGWMTSTRLIFGSSEPLKLLMRKFLGAFKHQFTAQSLATESPKVGLNVHAATSAHVMVLWMLKEVGPAKDQAGDFAGFEYTLCMLIIQLIISEIDKWYQMGRDYEPWHSKVRHAIAKTITDPLIQVNDLLLLARSVHPSGEGMTAEINSALNDVCYRVVVHVLLRRAKVQYSPTDYDKFIRHPVVGDDHINHVANSLAVHMPFSSVVGAFKDLFGMKLTDYRKLIADKPHLWPEFHQFGEIEFLKRTFVWDGAYYHMALRKSVIFELTNWVSHGRDPRLALRDNCVQAILEAFHWGPTFFAEVSNLINEELFELDIDRITFDYSDLRIKYVSGGLGEMFPEGAVIN